MKTARSIRSQKWSSKPRIMLSEFTEEEIKRYAQIIENGNAIYECDNKRPEAFMTSATHLVCKFPSMTEKYLASVTSGKWVLKPSFLEKGLAQEEKHLWGVNIDPNHPESIQTAVVKWREKFVSGLEGIFSGWYVGLFITQQNVESFRAIIKAGKGNVIFVASNSMDKVPQDVLDRMTHAYCHSSYINYFYDMNIVGITLMNETALYNHVTQIDDFNVQEHLFDAILRNTSPAVFNDRKLTHSVTKIVLQKENIPVSMDQDVDDTEEEYSINLPDSTIQVFISKQQAFVESVGTVFNHSHSSLGILEASDMMALTLHSYDRTTGSPYNLHEIEFLKRLADEDQELLWEIVNKNKQPDPKILFSIIVVLLNAKSNYESWQAHNLLCFILMQHPTNSTAVREIYQKSIKLYTKPFDEEGMNTHSSFLKDIASKLPCISKFGPLWNFFSSVSEGAIKECTNFINKDQSEEKCCILLNFLALIVIEDFEYVKVAIDSLQNPETCFQADLIWVRQGTSYSIENQEPVLANLVQLFIKAANLLLTQSSNSTVQYDKSKKVFKNISAFLNLSLSWASHIDSLQTGYMGYSSMRNVIISKFIEHSNDLDISLFCALVKYIPISIRVHILTRKIEQTSFGLLSEEENANIDDALSLSSIVNRYMCFIPHLHVDGSEDLLKTTKQVLKNVVYKNIAPDIAKKVNKRNAKGETPLLIACKKGNIEAVKNLLQTPGVDASCRDNYGWTPLGEACGAGHVECVRELLKLPIKQGSSLEPKLEIDLCACPELGDTPLHEAIENSNFEITKMLLEKGGKGLLQVFNKEGYTPIDKCVSDEFRRQILHLTETTANFVIDENFVGGQIHLEPIKALPDDAVYKSVLSHVKQQHREIWQNNVEALVLLITTLLQEYADYSEMFEERIEEMSGVENELRSISDIVVKIELDVNIKDEIPTSTGFCNSAASRRIESDISFALRWTKCWRKFKSHICKLTDARIKLNDPLKDCMLRVFEDF